MIRAWGVNVEMDAVTADTATPRSRSVAPAVSRFSTPPLSLPDEGAFAKDSPLTSELRV